MGDQLLDERMVVTQQLGPVIRAEALGDGAGVVDVAQHQRHRAVGRAEPAPRSGNTGSSAEAMTSIEVSCTRASAVVACDAPGQTRAALDSAMASETGLARLISTIRTALDEGRPPI